MKSDVLKDLAHKILSSEENGGDSLADLLIRVHRGGTDTRTEREGDSRKHTSIRHRLIASSNEKIHFSTVTPMPSTTPLRFSRAHEADPGGPGSEEELFAAVLDFVKRL